MKTLFKSFLLLLCCYMVLIVVNEGLRFAGAKIDGGTHFNRPTMNSAKADPDKCTWHCHNDTQYCMKHHNGVFGILNYLTILPYFTLITILKIGGVYSLANIILLVVAWPWYICWMIVRAFEKFKIAKYGH
jgi:hypothetical protein